MPDSSATYVADYAREGYAIVRGLFSPAEIAAISSGENSLRTMA
jgi:hypothetical protein